MGLTLQMVLTGLGEELTLEKTTLFSNFFSPFDQSQNRNVGE